MLHVSQLTGFNSGDNDPIKLTPDVGTWMDSMSRSLTTGGALGRYGQTNRQIIIGPSLLSFGGPKVKLVLQPNTLTVGASATFFIDALYIGEQATSGDVFDMKASAPAPTQFLVNGSGTFSTNAQQVTTDALTFTIDKTKTYIISTHYMDHTFGESDVGMADSVTGATNWSKNNTNEASTADVSSSGYFSDGTGSLRLITKVQVFVNIDTDVFYVPAITGFDPNWSSVVLLTGFEGANGSTVVTDQSSKVHGTATVTGAGTISTSQQKFGTSSFRFNGSSSVRWADHADWAFGSGNFTVECFFRIDAISGIQQLMGQWGASGDFGWRLWINNQFLNWNVSTTGINNVADMSISTLTANTWYHVCVDYDGSKYRLYKNGVMIASAITPRTIFDSTAQFALGSNSGASDYMTGYMDEIRVTKGVARYHSDSGFTVPTVAYPRG